MATFLTTRKELVADLEAARARISQLEAQLDESERLAEKAVGDMQEVAENMASAEASMSELTAQRDAAVARVSELEQANAELAEKVEVTAETVSIEASRMLAATTGHDPVAVDGPEDEEASDPVSTLARLHGGERTKFWKENRRAIIEAMRRR